MAERRRTPAAESGATGGEMTVPPWRTPKKPPRTRQPLSQDAIVDAALRIIDAEGLDALSMRRVAQEFDTGAASLYAHVGNKEELVELALERVMGEIEIPPPDPEHWQDQLKTLAREGRRVLSAHADIAHAAMANIPTGVNALTVGEGMLAILREGGLPDQVAAWAIDVLSLYLTADVVEGALHVKRGHGTRDGVVAKEYVGEIEEFYSRLPRDRFPHSTAILGALMAGSGDERFEFGLDTFIRGLSTYVEK